MLLKQMKYFITVVDCNSFTEAAEECFISQSAISQQIKTLEKELGVSLLIREGRQFSLTPAGEYFYRHGKVLLDEIEEFKEETIRRGEDDEINMTIGYPKNFSTIELYETIARFTDTYPEVNISIVSGTHEELFEYLVEGQLDFKISEQRRAFNDDYYNYEIKNSECFVEISSRHPLAKHDILNIEDLKNLSCILVVSKGKEELEREFYEKTLGLSHRFLYANSLEEARLMVLSNRGYLPIDQIRQLPDPIVGIKRIPLYRKDKPIQRNYFACWNKEKTNYYIEEFAELLRRILNHKVG
jgi:Transcriptional regulator